ncbi:MAG: DUF6033 family protein [[Eubacterium] siraeum]|nr:DUF6033 family protein [[Eubacterium] siraeum]
MTDMYGVNNSVNIPNAYTNYGKNAQTAQSPQELQKAAAPKKAMRADEILFTQVYQADQEAVDALDLSDDAKYLLLELKEKYKGYDFMVGDYQSNEQASRILNGGKGTVMNVLITPALLEEMAADQSVRTKYENIIASAGDQFTEVKANLTESGKYYLGSMGLTVNEDGSCDYYAFLKNGLTAEDGKNFLTSSSAKGLADMLNSLAENRSKTESKENTSKTEKTDWGYADPNKLSDGARDVLYELMDKYKGYDFIVGNWETDEEASRVLSYGMGKVGNVLISPDLLERMAADESVKAEYEGIIDQAANNLTQAKDDLTEDGKAIVDRMGMTVDGEGNISYFAALIDGVKTDDGAGFMQSSLIKDLVNSLNSLAQNRKTENKENVSKTEWGYADPNKLSDGARDVLYELMEKYQGYDFIVGNWSTDEEASRVLSYGRGTDGNVLISPDLLERMAADESVKAEYEAIIDEAANGFAQAKTDLTEGGRSIVERLGMTVDGDGNVSYFAALIDGVKTDDGSDFVQSSLVKDLINSLNLLAQSREKYIQQTEERDIPAQLDTPEEKEEKVEKSVMPPKSYEKYEKEEEPYSTEKDYGTLPPKSFEKYKKEESPYSTEEDYGTLPPESFKKYQTEAAANTEEAGSAMNFKV